MERLMLIPLVVLAALSMGMIATEPEGFLRFGWSVVLFAVGYSLGVLSDENDGMEEE